MVKFIIEIEEVAGEPNGVNVLFRSEKQQPTQIEEALAKRLEPLLRALPSSLSGDPPSE
jgi:hypothetical protein